MSKPRQPHPKTPSEVTEWTAGSVSNGPAGFRSTTPRTAPSLGPERPKSVARKTFDYVYRKPRPILVIRSTLLLLILLVSFTLSHLVPWARHTFPLLPSPGPPFVLDPTPYHDLKMFTSTLGIPYFVNSTELAAEHAIERPEGAGRYAWDASPDSWGLNPLARMTRRQHLLDAMVDVAYFRRLKYEPGKKRWLNERCKVLQWEGLRREVGARAWRNVVRGLRKESVPLCERLQTEGVIDWYNSWAFPVVAWFVRHVV